MTIKRTGGAEKLSTMRVLIAETPPDYTIDGMPVGELKVGGEYELPTNIAEVLLALQIAVLPLGSGGRLQSPPPRTIQ